jgi:hypothetical protein
METPEEQKPQETPVPAPKAVLKYRTPADGADMPLPEVSEEVRDALTLANRRIRQGLERHIDLCYRAYRRGAAASFGKFSRTSTEYGDPILDAFFYSGFDGMSWEEAVRTHIVD